MPIGIEELKKQKDTYFKILANGGFGSGKSHFGLTFPKVAWIANEPGWKNLIDANEELQKNLVWAEDCVPSPTEDIKETMGRLDKAIIKAHEDFKVGKIQTLFFDNMTYHSENKWQYINKYERLISKSGELDTRGMYGTLSRNLYLFTLVSLLSFPGNVVVSCHEQVEGDEAMGKKVDKTTPIVSNILGGFREKIGGMFSASIYLECKRVGENQYKYLARCRKGGQKDAKNRLGLPEIVENISYGALLASLPNKGKGGQEVNTVVNKTA